MRLRDPKPQRQPTPADQLPHDARVVGPFRVPPTFDATIDSAADFPGPGTISLDGSLQLQ